MLFTVQMSIMMPYYNYSFSLETFLFRSLLLFHNLALSCVISWSSRRFIHSPVGELLQSHPQFPAFSGTDVMVLIGLSAFQGSEKNAQRKSDLCIAVFQGKGGFLGCF